jgi:hypothetical protein
MQQKNHANCRMECRIFADWIGYNNRNRNCFTTG